MAWNSPGRTLYEDDTRPDLDGTASLDSDPPIQDEEEEDERPAQPNLVQDPVQDFKELEDELNGLKQRVKSRVFASNGVCVVSACV